jgi:hypothetical protein
VKKSEMFLVRVVFLIPYKQVKRKFPKPKRKDANVSKGKKYAEARYSLPEKKSMISLENTEKKRIVGREKRRIYLKTMLVKYDCFVSLLFSIESSEIIGKSEAERMFGINVITKEIVKAVPKIPVISGPFKKFKMIY